MIPIGSAVSLHLPQMDPTVLLSGEKTLGPVGGGVTRRVRKHRRSEGAPRRGQRLTIGGDHNAGENSQIDFKKRDNDWVIERIFVFK